MTGGRQSEGFLRQARIAVAAYYLGFLFFANLIWEFAHMPLYTVWRDGSQEEIVYSGIHCTFGDLMIGAASLLVAIVVVGRPGWPRSQQLRVAFVTIVVGLSYTVFSEWLNVFVRESWSYSELMPLLPGTSIGLSPVAQWLILPIFALSLAYRSNILSDNAAVNLDDPPSVR